MSNFHSLLLYCGFTLITICILKYTESINVINDFTTTVIRLDKNNIIINKYKLIAFLGFIPMWVLIAFRDKTVGIDAGGTYYRTFRYVSSGEFANHRGVVTEFGYMILNKICLYFSDSYHLVLFITGTATWFLFYRYILKESPCPSLSILLFFLSFFYFHQYNVIRQLLAMGIAMQGFHFIYERKFIKWVCIMAFAMTFHVTAVLLIPVFFLYGRKIAFSQIFISVFGSKLLFNVAKKAASVLLVGTKYYSILYSTAAYESGYAWADLVCNSILLIIGYIIYRNGEIEGEKDDVLSLNIWLQLIAVVIAINSNNIPIPYRLLWYANCNTMIFIPYVLKKIKKTRNLFVVRLLILCLYLVYFTYDWIASVDLIQNYSFYKG